MAIFGHFWAFLGKIMRLVIYFEPPLLVTFCPFSGKNWTSL